MLQECMKLPQLHFVGEGKFWVYFHRLLEKQHGEHPKRSKQRTPVEKAMHLRTFYFHSRGGAEGGAEGAKGAISLWCRMNRCSLEDHMTMMHRMRKTTAKCLILDSPRIFCSFCGAFSSLCYWYFFEAWQSPAKPKRVRGKQRIDFASDYAQEWLNKFANHSRPPNPSLKLQCNLLRDYSSFEVLCCAEPILTCIVSHILSINVQGQR